MAARDFNIDRLKTALTGGGARPSLFEFNLTGVPTQVGTGLNNINLYTQVSALPPLTVTPIEKQYFGRTVKIPGDITFGDLTTTIYQTETGAERGAIEGWMDHINGHVSNVISREMEGNTGGAWGKYAGTAELLQYGKDGKLLLKVQFEDCWPQSISEIALSYDTASDLEQFDVTWSYQHYRIYGQSGQVTKFPNIV